MTAAALLAHLQSLDVRLALDGDRLVCNAPKGALTAELRAQLAQQKAELIGLLRALDGGAEPDSAPIPVVPRQGVLPLSYAQERMWFLEQMEGVGGVYGIPVGVRLRGKLDMAGLTASLNAIVARHEALRTIFREVGGRGNVVITPHLTLELPLVDLTGLEAERQAAAVERLRTEEAAAVFDLVAGPLVRGRLLRLASDEHVLLLTLHHTVADGWSLGVLLKELAEGYAARGAGRRAALPELPVQYVDYAGWQRERLHGGVLDEQLAYWQEQLAGELPVLALPTDRPRPAVQNFRGACKRFVLDSELTSTLEALAGREGVTPFMILLATYASLLSRYSGQEDLVIGTPIAGRLRRELEPLIGLFVNTLPLRLNLSGDPDGRGLLRRVRETALAAFAHQEVPFEKLVERLGGPRDLSRAPLFAAMFILQNAPLPDLRLGDLSLEVLPDPGQTAKFDLTLEIERRGDQYLACWNYRRDLFEPATIARMAVHYERLLRELLVRPERRLSAQRMLDHEEERTLLVEFNATRRAYPGDACVHELLEVQAQRTPEAVALIYADQTLTYRELQARSDELAGYLQALGVGPDSLVGICAERSLEMVVGLLGILKAGGAYVPIDPSYPRERLAYMLADSGVAVLLTQRHLGERLPEHAARIVYLDESIPGRGPVRRGGVKPDHLAYMIYTSGSTGQPKGAMITHRAIVNRLLWMQEEYGLTAADRVLQKTPFSFDVSVWEFFWPLLTGATLVIARPEGHKDSTYLVRTIREYAVTTVHFVPSMLAVFLEERGAAGCATLTRVMCSGEALSWELKERFYGVFGTQGGASRVGRCELHNLYGPTEAAVDVSYWSCAADTHDRRVVPIGWPVANTRLHVLDRHLQPVPVGVTGELYIAGVQVGRGYWARPELTAERFIPHPFSEEPGARMYKTGDLARYLPDGNIEYLGRLDHQVKIRGFRIELGEIESCLRLHVGVREAAVIDAELRGEKQLAAYLIRRGDGPLDVAELRGFLKGKLPDYMVPAAFVKLEVLPLLPNGKLDRKALPAPDGAMLALVGREPVAPRTPTEQRVQAIWREVLGGGEVGVEDDFFAVGGHSLMATQVMARVRDGLGVELPLRTLFEAPTIAALAARIERAHRDDETALSLPAVRRDRPLPVSFAQERMWFLEQMEGAGGVYNIPIAVRLVGDLCAEALAESLNAVVARHETLRMVFGQADAQSCVEIGEGLRLELPLVDLARFSSVQREAELERWRREEAGAAFDLLEGPLVRAKLLRLDICEHVLLLTLHHTVADGWSLGVLLKELAELYAARVAGRAAVLPELPAQYVDYAQWQRERLASGALDGQLAYWREQLSGELPVLALPTDQLRPAVQTFRGASRRFELDQELTQALEAFSAREGVTPFMTLLAALAGVLSRYTGQEDLVIGTPIAGRVRTELEPLVGLFVNTLPLRMDLAGDPDVRRLLGRIRETALSAYAHQEVPFEKVMETLGLQRDLSRSPLFQVMFILQNAPMPHLELGGLSLSVIPEAGETAKFDLTLEVERLADRYVACWNYNRDLFAATTIERLAGHYERLLRELLARPEQRLSAVWMLNAQEEQTLLVEFNATRRAYPGDVCVHELLEVQARRTPAAIALSYEGQTLTYRELQARSDELAGYLQGLGVGPESLVGICAERSLEMVVGLLGILKAGGAYVPLDPSYPRERLAYMLADSEVVVLLTQRRLGTRLPEHAARVVYLDEPMTGGGPVRRSGVGPDNLAYMIYTSGSTGQPKGAMITHRGLVNYLSWCTPAYGASAGNGSVVHSSLSFDLTVTSLFPPLLTGRTVHLLPERLGIEALAEAFGAANDWSLVKITPPHLELLARQVPAEKASGRTRAFVIGGENLTADHVAFWRQHSPETMLVNEYGPTETVVGCCVYEVPRDGDVTGVLPIGRPIANTRLYVLDAHLNAVPVGVVGELYIGGDGVARGYWNRTELTAERFIPDQFGGVPGARLYRTGDRVRFLPSGDLECLGRVDQQVKIRGYRIELGEVESALQRQPVIREAVVQVSEDAPGQKRLVAYLVARDGAALELDEVRQALLQTLPEYMVPAAFVQMKALPLTHNGKVDRKALPAPDQETRLRAKRECVPPSTPAERALAAVWAELLGAAEISTRDNYFELGGDSILSMRMIARLRERGFKLATRQVFQYPTLAEMAAVAEAVEAIAGEQGPAVGEVVPSPIQRWFFEQELAEPQHWNQSVFLSVAEPIAADVLAAALRAVLVHHDMLRLRVEGGPGAWRLRIAPPDAAVPMERFDFSQMSVSQQDEAMRAQAARLQASLDLANGPIVRVAWFDRGAHQSAGLLIIIHHLAVDGVSWRILLEDMEAALRQAREGRAIQLPARTHAFPQWTQRLAGLADTEELRQEAAWWLAENAAGQSLPVDGDRVANLESSVRVVTRTLDAEATTALLSAVPAAYHTRINDVLLAALLEAGARWMGQPWLRVALEGHGREDLFEGVDVSRTVGWFTTLYPVTLRRPERAGPGELLKAVKEQLRRVPRGGVSYGLLRYGAGETPEAMALRKMPEPELCFNYLGQFDEAASGSSLLWLSDGPTGPNVGPGNRRRYLIEINAAVAGGMLRVDWRYGANRHDRATMERLADDYMASLGQLIAHCRSPEAGGFTPSDFPLAGLSGDDLEKLSRLLKPGGS